MLPAATVPLLSAPRCHALPSSPPSPTSLRSDARARLTVGLQDPEDLVAGDGLDLGNAVGVTEDNADLGRGETSLGELEDLLGDVLGRGLGPRRLGASVGQRRSGDTLAVGVHSGRSARSSAEACSSGRSSGRASKVLLLAVFRRIPPKILPFAPDARPLDHGIVLAIWLLTDPFWRVLVW